MYRPQFAYERPPAEFDDVDFNHYFDSTNTPLLNNTSLAAGGTVLNIPLQMQTDFPFYLRAMQIKGSGVGVTSTAFLPPGVQIRWKDPYHHDLSNDYVPVYLYVAPSIVSSTLFTGIPNNPPINVRNNPLAVVFEPEVQCPAGSIWWLSIRNPFTVAVDLTQLRILFTGIKRQLADGGGCAS